MLDLEDLKLARIAAEVLSRATSPKTAAFAALRDKLTAEVSARTPGPCVFRLSIPLEVSVSPPPTKRGKARKPVDILLAPRLNEYAGMEPWVLALARAELDRRIILACSLWPLFDCGSERVVSAKTVLRKKRKVMLPKLSVSGGRRRILEITRHSSREVDELAVDILGGKLVVDRMIWAGVIAGDARKHIVRVPRWERAKPMVGRLDVAVYELP